MTKRKHFLIISNTVQNLQLHEDPQSSFTPLYRIKVVLFEMIDDVRLISSIRDEEESLRWKTLMFNSERS